MFRCFSMFLDVISMFQCFDVSMFLDVVSMFRCFDVSRCFSMFLDVSRFLAGTAGTCTCMAGFTGGACERLKCPTADGVNGCSGNGKTMVVGSLDRCGSGCKSGCTSGCKSGGRLLYNSVDRLGIVGPSAFLIRFYVLLTCRYFLTFAPFVPFVPFAPFAP